MPSASGPQRPRSGRATTMSAALAGLVGLAVLCAGCGTAVERSDPTRNADARQVTLRISANAAVDGKNAEEARWITQQVIPRFTAMMRARGVEAEVRFLPSGVDDEQYKTKVALDLKSGTGADIVTLDSIWVGEFAEADYIRPLRQTAGAGVDGWEGWRQIKPAVQRLTSFNGQRYGIPLGTDGRVLFYNRRLFRAAGLNPDWQPRSWSEVLAAAAALARLDGVAPLQINAGTAMGEATTMQGVLPLLSASGQRLYAGGRWLGERGLEPVLDFYQRVYAPAGGARPLGDPRTQQEAKGRDASFQRFAQGRVGILLESDYFWRSVVDPEDGVAPMADRDAEVGYALLPARQPGAAVDGQNFVSASGGTGRFLNPRTRYPRQAWELLAFMNSAESLRSLVASDIRITPRDDVNAATLAGDPMLSYVATNALPVTTYRPPLAVYPQVSKLLQEATAAVVAGASPRQAARQYRLKLEEVVGAGNINP